MYLNIRLSSWVLLGLLYRNMIAQVIAAPTGNALPVAENSDNALEKAPLDFASQFTVAGAQTLVKRQTDTLEEYKKAWAATTAKKILKNENLREETPQQGKALPLFSSRRRKARKIGKAQKKELKGIWEEGGQNYLQRSRKTGDKRSARIISNEYTENVLGQLASLRKAAIKPAV
jgi:hypothetical protein